MNFRTLLAAIGATVVLTGCETSSPQIDPNRYAVKQIEPAQKKVDSSRYKVKTLPNTKKNPYEVLPLPNK